MHKSGYVYLHAPQHPRANAHGYVFEHRLVMEQMLGRLLEPREIVHHKNHDRGDNRPENLELIASQSEHMREHPENLEKARAVGAMLRSARKH